MSPAVITLLVLLVMVVFFVTEKLPAALVAMLGGSVLVLCGIIDPAELFSAFSGSTIVLVAAMMVVGSALFHTGIAAKMADVLVKFTGTSENGIMIAFMLVATIISAVCSGVAVVAMLLPIVISVSQRAGVSVSRQLIPMSFAASFGCNLTLMGAASNVVVNGALEDLGVPTMTFFELGKVGIPVSIAGIVFFLTIGKRFLTPGDTSDREYLAEYTGSNKAVEFNAVKAGLCLVILAVLLVAMAIDSDSFPMYLVAAFAAFVLVLTGCISQSDAYKSIDLSTLFIVAGMSAVSTGMSKSGAGALIADTAVNLLGEHPNKLLVLFYYSGSGNSADQCHDEHLLCHAGHPVVHSHRAGIWHEHHRRGHRHLCGSIRSVPDPGGQRHQHPDRPSGQPEVHGLLPPRPGADGGHSHRIHDLHSHFLASVSDF